MHAKHIYESPVSNKCLMQILLLINFEEYKNE